MAPNATNKICAPATAVLSWFIKAPNKIQTAQIILIYPSHEHLFTKGRLNKCNDDTCSDGLV